jgi:hypothetical protein
VLQVINLYIYIQFILGIFYIITYDQYFKYQNVLLKSEENHFLFNYIKCTMKIDCSSKSHDDVFLIVMVLEFVLNKNISSQCKIQY